MPKSAGGAASALQHTKRRLASFMPGRQQPGSPPTDDPEYASSSPPEADTPDPPSRKRKAAQSSNEGRRAPFKRPKPRLIIDRTSTQLHCNQAQQRLQQLHTQLKQQQELLALQQQQLQVSQRKNQDLLNIIYALVAAAAKQKSNLAAAGAADADAPAFKNGNNSSNSSSKQSTHSAGSVPGATAETIGQEPCRMPEMSGDSSEFKPVIGPTPLAAVPSPAAVAAPSPEASAFAASGNHTSEGLLFAPAHAAAVSNSMTAAAPAAANGDDDTQNEQHLLQMIASARGEEDLMMVFEEALQPIKKQQQQLQTLESVPATMQQKPQQQLYLSSTQGQLQVGSQSPRSPPAGTAASTAGPAAMATFDVYTNLFFTQQQQQAAGAVGLPSGPQYAADAAAVLSTVGSSSTDFHVAAVHLENNGSVASPVPLVTAAANDGSADSSRGFGHGGCSSSLFCPPLTTATAPVGIAVTVHEVFDSADALSDLPSCTDLVSMLEDLEQGELLFL